MYMNIFYTNVDKLAIPLFEICLIPKMICNSYLCTKISYASI